MASMSRKHYTAIATAIHNAVTVDHAAPGSADSVARRIADALAADNPRFDRSRFLKACGTLAEPEPTIHDLMESVRSHPDYVFGTYFVTADFPGESVPDDFPDNRATDALAEAGNEFIYQNVEA